MRIVTYTFIRFLWGSLGSISLNNFLNYFYSSLMNYYFAIPKVFLLLISQQMFPSCCGFGYLSSKIEGTKYSSNKYVISLQADQYFDS